MLHKFTFSNFKSFRDIAEIDLKASKISEFKDHTTEVGRDKILKVIAIFGANASGKSTVHEAFEYMTYFVVNSFKFGGDEDGDDKTSISIPHFSFDEISQDVPAFFEVLYSYPNDATEKTYRYGFKICKSEVHEEWLESCSKSSNSFKPILSRNKKQLMLYGSTRKWEENILLSLEDEVLAISLGAKLKIPRFKDVRDWFVSNCIVSFGDPVETFFRSRTIPKDFPDDKKVQQKVVDYLHTFDKSITGFHVTKKPPEKDKEESYRIDAVHGKYRIPLEDESSGTLKMFELYPYLSEVMRNGTVLFVDELNEKLHPFVVRNLINTFISPDLNPKNAQLIFTTHDVYQLSKDVLRRDEILFIQKNNEGVSHMVSLANMTDENGVKIRKDENFEKNYLLGNYGAVPEIQEIEL